MSNYTPEQYAESARKYGITQGPYSFGRAKNGRLYVFGADDRPVCGGFSARAGRSSQAETESNGNALASLPNLLIERDALKVENERLRAALDLVQIYGMRIGGMSPDDSLREVVITARAALKGGA